VRWGMADLMANLAPRARERGWLHEALQVVAQKKQGRRRSMPSTTLPAPDIEIGLRHPVCLKMHRNYAGTCDLSHNLARKFRPPPLGCANLTRRKTIHRHHPPIVRIREQSRDAARQDEVRPLLAFDLSFVA